MADPGSLPCMATRVFVDADVLFSRTLRDWLFLLKLESTGELFTVATSLDVIVEATARYRDRYPTVNGAVITSMFNRINANVDELVQEYAVDGTFVGVDEGDSHVDAAARACRADVLLTQDTDWHGLAPEQSDQLHYEVQRPDDFFCIIDASAPGVVNAAVVIQTKYWFAKNGEADLPERLRRAGCPNFADRVRLQLQSVDCSLLKS